MTACKYLLRRGMSVLCIDSTDPSRNDCDHCIDIKCFDSRPLSDELKMERIKTMGCIHAKMRAKFTLAVKEIDAFFESLRGEP